MEYRQRGRVSKWKIRAPINHCFCVPFSGLFMVIISDETCCNCKKHSSFYVNFKIPIVLYWTACNWKGELQNSSDKLTNKRACRIFQFLVHLSITKRCFQLRSANIILLQSGLYFGFFLQASFKFNSFRWLKWLPCSCMLLFINISQPKAR